MLRDQAENTMDMEVLDDIPMEDLNYETIQGYRNRHRILKYNIVRHFPEYFLDYREMLDPAIRWTDRIQSSSGIQEINLLWRCLTSLVLGNVPAAEYRIFLTRGQMKAGRNL